MLLFLEYHMKKAYDIVFKDKIMIYSLEGMKLDDFQFKVIAKDFAKLILKILGLHYKVNLNFFMVIKKLYYLILQNIFIPNMRMMK